MAVRKRTWKSGGKTRQAFVADYYVDGNRFVKAFATKGEAKDHISEVDREKEEGRQTDVHQAKKTFATVAQEWLSDKEAEGKERSTIDQWRQHIKHHLDPRIGKLKLSPLTDVRVKQLRRELVAGLSPAMRPKVWGTLRAIVAAEAPPAILAAVIKHRIKSSKRHQKRVEPPTREEVRLLLEHAKGRWRPLLWCAAFTGMRAGELRGLAWSNVDFDTREINVTRRADRYGEIDSPKTPTSRRTIPLSRQLMNILKEWKVECPVGELDLVFPTGRGNIEGLGNISRRGFGPLQVECGIVDEDGKPKYGMHALRHWYASHLIGLGYDIKKIQTYMGHASAMMTLDVYGHLLPSEDDHERLDDGELAVVGA